MRLETIEGKRGDCEISVQLPFGVVYLTGPNGSGKTTTLDLVRYGLSGERDRSALSRVDTSVRLGFDGATVRRSYTADAENNKNTLGVVAQGHGRSEKPGVAEGIIAAAIGSAWSWNAGAVLGSTPTERRKLLAAVLGPALTTAAIKAAIRAAGAGRSDLPAEVWPDLDAGLAALGRLKPDEGPEFATGWLGLLRSTKTATQARAEAARKAVETAEQRVEAAGALPGSEPAWTERLAELRKREAALRAQQAGDGPARALYAELERGVAEARDAVTHCRVRQTTTAARWRLDHPVLVEAATQARAAAKLAAAAEETARAARDEAARAALVLASAADEERLAVSASVAAGVLALDLDVVLNLAGKWIVWREQHDTPESYANEYPTHRPALERLAALRSGAAEQQARQQAGALRAAQTRQTVMDKAWRHADSQCQAADVAAVNAEATLARRTAEHEAWTARDELGPLNAALDAATARLTAAPTPPPVADLTASIEAVRLEVADAEATLRHILDYVAITADRDRCVEAAHTMARVRNELHEAEKRCERTIGELFVEAVRPLVEPASRITEAVTGRRVSVHPGIDWRIDLGDQPVEHLSESDTMILGCALHAAVVLTSAAAWKGLLLDGTEAIESHRRGALLVALAREKFDNVLVAGVDDGGDAAWLAEGWLRDETIAIVNLGIDHRVDPYDRRAVVPAEHEPYHDLDWPGEAP